MNNAEFEFEKQRKEAIRSLMVSVALIRQFSALCHDKRLMAKGKADLALVCARFARGLLIELEGFSDIAEVSRDH